MIVVELVVEVSEPVSEVAAAGQPLVQPPGLSCDMARRGDGHQSSHQGDNDIKKYWSQRERHRGWRETSEKETILPLRQITGK